jgi:tripartite-type tricarboxylate transporter receptor subunit TctC
MDAKLAAFAALVVVNLASGFAAHAQGYPARPVTLVVPFAPGGSIDIVGRILGEQLSSRLGRPFIVENRPGGGTNVAAAAVARATPDGYTLLITTSSLAINPTLYKKLAYDPTNDFVPVALVASIPLVLVVNPSLPARSAGDLVALAKEKRVSLSYASGGSGSAPHLAGELFKSMAAIDMTHVPYRGAPQALTDVVAGHVQVMFADPGTALPQMRDGKVRALGVTSPTPVPGIPGIAPIAQTGLPSYDAVSWQLILAPAKTPPDIVDRLHAEIKELAAQREIKARFAGLGLAPVESPSPKALQRFVSSEIQRWGEIVRRAGVAGSE